MDHEERLELQGIFSEGYGIIPKKLMRMKLDELAGKGKGKNIKLIISHLLSYTGAGNTCFPGIDRIADELEMSRGTVIDALKAASEIGLITKGKVNPNSMKQQNKYTLNFLPTPEPSENPALFKESVVSAMKDKAPGKKQKPQMTDEQKALRTKIIDMLYVSYQKLYGKKPQFDGKEMKAIEMLMKKSGGNITEIKHKHDILIDWIQNSKDMFKRSQVMIPSSLNTNWNRLVDAPNQYQKL